MSQQVPYRNRIQRFLRVDAFDMFSVNAFRIALLRALKRLLPTLSPSHFPSSLKTSIFGVAAGDETTPAVVASNLVTYMVPTELTIKEISASLTIAQASGADLFIADVLKNGVSIMTTNKLSFDNGENSTITATTSPTLTTTTLSAGDKLTVDVTQIGDGTAAGLKVYLVVEI